MRPVESLLGKLADVERRDGYFQALCPAHDDQKRSLSVKETDDGRALVHCHAGCSSNKILRMLDLSWQDLFPGSANGNNNSDQKLRHWPLKDAEGKLVAVHHRKDGPAGKTIWWRGPNGERTLKEIGLDSPGLPLYRSEYAADWPPEVPVVVVEGEKAADALARIHPATLGTVTGASETPGRAALDVLRDRSVVLWPDADEVGRKHMRLIAGRLQSIAAVVRIFTWAGAPAKGDAADHPAVKRRSQKDAEKLLGTLAAAPVCEPDASSSSSSLLWDSDDDDDASGLRWFSKLGKPKPRAFIIEDLLPESYATTLYGTGGVAKSILALLLGVSYAGDLGHWLGLKANGGGPVLYLDFELDANEQLRRVRDLCAGQGVPVPDGLGYISAIGKRSREAFDAAFRICRRHGVRLLILDSLGPAMLGDAEKAKDVIAFYNEYVAPFRAMGVTILLIDHQGKLQAGERYQEKTSLGSAYKQHLVRSAIQVEAVRRDRENGTLTVRLRHTKSNFGPRRDPLDVKLTFGQGRVTAEPVEVDAADLAGEGTLNADDRVALALQGGAAYPDELAERTGLAAGTVKNCLTRLRNAGTVEDTGQVKVRARQVRLASSSSSPSKRSDDDNPQGRVNR